MRSMELGYMVSLRDIGSLRVPDADFIELLLFDGDSEIGPGELKRLSHRKGPALRFVHAQEFVSVGGKEVLLDLASENDTLKRRSLQAVEFARDLARSIGGSKVVVHPGGIREGQVDRRVLFRTLSRSLEELGPDLLLLENMPWFYWLKGSGRMVANLCASYHDMTRLADLVEGVTLDTSHGYLSRPDGDERFCEEFISVLGGKLAHIHASDAKVPDEEGLQIGDGEINFSFLSSTAVPVLVEVWDGHKNGGEGFRIGIQRLRSVSDPQRSEPRRSVAGGT